MNLDARYGDVFQIETTREEAGTSQRPKRDSGEHTMSSPIGAVADSTRTKTEKEWITFH